MAARKYVQTLGEQLKDESRTTHPTIERRKTEKQDNERAIKNHKQSPESNNQRRFCRRNEMNLTKQQTDQINSINPDILKLGEGCGKEGETYYYCTKCGKEVEMKDIGYPISGSDFVCEECGVHRDYDHDCYESEEGWVEERPREICGKDSYYCSECSAKLSGILSQCKSELKVLKLWQFQPQGLVLYECSFCKINLRFQEGRISALKVTIQFLEGVLK